MSLARFMAIISEARLDFEQILKRTLLFAYEKKQLTDLEQLHHEAYQYISKKYGPQSELKVWLDYRKTKMVWRSSIKN